jgi:uncharacterized protein (TIGR02145 family)
MKAAFSILAITSLLLSSCTLVELSDEDNYANLSVSGTANCYVVSQKGDYKFLTVKGNGNTSVGAVSHAEVLWESFGTDVAPNTGDLIKNISYSDGKIKFQTADTYKEGNAAIAAKDASGNILWSWHIWFTDQPEEQVYFNNAGTMMDRNLGATSATPGDVGALGLLYQWGRKDPFPGFASINEDKIAATTITWPRLVTSNADNGTIEFATANPTTFITKGSNPDWLYTQPEETETRRWTVSDMAKSIYDPCPVGWRIPDGGEANGIWAKALSSLKQTSDRVNCGIDFSGALGNDPVIWYPAAGHRSSNWSGQYYYVGGMGYYWSASPYTYDSRYLYHMLFEMSGSVTLYSSINAAYGLSVRCAKE